MRYPASEKLEIIRLVEGSPLPTKRTLDKLGIPRTTFYRWYVRYLSGGPEALEDRRPKPSRVWNRIPEPVREKVKELALRESDLSPRELAVRFTDTNKYFVSEASVYRILKSCDLITSPAYVVLSAADAFRDKTTRPDQLWQTNFTYLKGEPLCRHVFETNGERLGLVLSVGDPGRLQPRPASASDRWRPDAEPSPGSLARP